MKIYSDKLTQDDVRQAIWDARQIDGADIWVDSIRSFRPRRHAHGTELYAQSMGGTRATGHRQIGSYDLSGEARAASWDAYGHVIARLFAQDPDARIANYNGVQDFIRQVEATTYRREPKDFLDKVRQS